MNIDQCRVCGSPELEDCVFLGDQPWCNDFVESEKVGQENTYPLTCAFCSECSTLQVRYTVPKEIMYADHTYLSGSTSTMKVHFQNVSDHVCGNLINSSDGFVVDIGSNDGTLLRCYQNNGMEVLGVEASSDIGSIARSGGVPTLTEYFNLDIAKTVIKEHGKADVVSAANVFYHVEELHSIVDGVKELLSEDGVFVVQASYLPNLIRNNAFDIMYHEHLLYYRLENLDYLLKLHGLEVFDVQEAEVHGGSIIVYACHEGQREKSRAVLDMISQEQAEGFDRIGVYKQFDSNIKQVKSELQSMLNNLKAEGKTVYAYGAPAKGTVMVNYCGVTSELVPYAAEVNQLKFGRFIPCTGIEIRDENELPEPDYYLLLSWNFLEEFMGTDAFRSGKRKFIVPLPLPAIKTARVS